MFLPRPVTAFVLVFALAGAALLPPVPAQAVRQRLPGFSRRQAATSSTVEPRLLAAVDTRYCSKVLGLVDELVRKHFFEAKLAQSAWPAILARHRQAIVASSSLKQLSERLNAAIKELKSSHCQFVTINDETYYFLHTLFHCSCAPVPTRVTETFFRSHPRCKMDYTGAVTGGVGCNTRQVRYVLDGSPAQGAGVKVGDEILSIDGRPYTGQLSLDGCAGRSTRLSIARQGKTFAISLTPELKDDAGAYVEAIGKSVAVFDRPEGKIGYVHLWSGGSAAHEAFEEALSGKLQQTDALIVDFRDGYGGNFFDDLDFFYRPPAGYPSFSTISRLGKRDSSHLCYDKPLVSIINSGVRSGRELLAYSLKKTGRAVLVGENTAGAVLAGRLFPVDDRCSLYLAVARADVGSTCLEGVGVAPDVEVKLSASERGVHDTQLSEALRIAFERLSGKGQ